ncbi:MAG: hypothetical protein AAGL98_10410, partial [Planctomycetota bacterium]
EYLRDYTPHELEQEARDLAGAFLFSGDSQDKPLSVLSGGERARAVLAGLVNGGHNLLVLDEPTNHLDIPSAERLEETLRTYTTQQQAYSTAGNQSHAGTLILITHDRMLLDNLADQLLVFDGAGGVTHFLGTYSEWHEQQQAANLLPGPGTSAPTNEPPKTKPKSSAVKQTQDANRTKNNKIKNKAKKNSADGGKAKNRAGTKMSQAKLESEIERLESRLHEIDFALMDPEVFSDGDKIKSLQAEREAKQEELKPLEREWARRAG